MGIITFILSFATWIILSGRFDGFHLTLGIVSCVIVTVLSGRALYENGEKTLTERFSESFRFVHYLVWLLYQIIKANIRVLYLALHPRVKEVISPSVFAFKSELKTKFAQVVLANSITLTPGTVTVRLIDDIFTVHMIEGDFAKDITGQMQRRVARVFEPDTVIGE